MKRTFINCGRKDGQTLGVGRILHLAAWGLLLLCAGARLAGAQYVSKTLATSNANLTIDGYGIAVDSSGNVYATGSYPFVSASQRGGPVVEKIVPANALVAGNGSNFPGCGFGQTQTGFTDLGGLAVDASGNLYLAQSGNGPVLRFSGGITTCLTGSNNYFWATGVAPDGAGGAYFSVASGWEVYHVTAAGVVTLLAGTSNQIGCGVSSTSPTGTMLGNPNGLAVDPSGNLFIADRWCNVVWKFVPSTRALTVVAGTPNKSGYFGDNGQATLALLNQPTGVALDPEGNVYIADWANDAIRLVRNSDHSITTIAGNGLPGHYDDPNHATSSTFNGPFSIALGPSGNVYVGEDLKGNSDIRELVLMGRASMIAPTPGSVLTSPATKFTWTTVPNVDQYRLTMGSSAGMTDYFDDAGSILTTAVETVPNVPCDGRSLYVQLFTKLDGYWLPAQQYTYTASKQCAVMVTPTNGSVLGITQTFTWTSAPGATGYQLNVAYISPSGSTVTNKYSTASTSFTVNNLPCDGKPILVQLTTVLSGVAMPPGNYAYTACKMLYLYASPTTVPASGGTVDLYLYAFAPPPGSANGQLSLTESIVYPAPACIYNPWTHQWICPTPTTLFSFPITTTYGEYYEYLYTLNVPAAPANYLYGTTFGFTASFTINGMVVDTATATVTRY
jgi:hypothetical protein